jgi:hypothetical protein
MGKAIKLDKQKQKETEVLANRIMPKTDFEKVIEHDKLYFNTLKEALDFNIIKRDILAKESEKVLKNQTEENITKNIPLLTEWADTKLKILDLQGKLRVQQTLVDDKIMHFENVFLPQFEKESKEAKENLENALIKANQIVEANEEYFEEICSKLVYELTWWNKVSSERKTNEEFMVQIYKPLKRLISAWEQKKDAQAQAKSK